MSVSASPLLITTLHTFFVVIVNVLGVTHLVCAFLFVLVLVPPAFVIVVVRTVVVDQLVGHDVTARAVEECIGCLILRILLTVCDCIVTIIHCTIIKSVFSSAVCAHTEVVVYVHELVVTLMPFQVMEFLDLAQYVSLSSVVPYLILHYH